MSRFEGDGRTKIEPDPRYVRPGTQPTSVTRGQARMIIEAFEKSGQSTHSAAGSTLWVIVEHCEEATLMYKLAEGRHHGEVFGYTVEKIG